MSFWGWGATVAAVAAIAVAVVVLVGLPAPEKGDDPLTVAPPNKPNWALAATAGVGVAAEPTLQAPVLSGAPDAVVARIAAFAAAEPRVARIDDGADPAYAAFIQRSALIGFPDVVSLRAVALADGGVGLALYSRSVYGHSDLGVNKARAEKWVQAAISPE